MYLLPKQKRNSMSNSNKIVIQDVHFNELQCNIINEWASTKGLSIHDVYHNKKYISEFKVWNSNRIRKFADCQLYEDQMDEHIEIITKLGYYD